jgi:tRNA modification GTPase
VSPEPGTTRDFIEERIIVGPHCLRIIDTAGLNPSPAPLEKRGMEKTLERAAEADLFLLVFDLGHPTPVLPAELLMNIRPDKCIIIFNKSDLYDCIGPISAIPGAPVFRVSALTGSGFEELTTAIISCAESFQKTAGIDDVAINSRHAYALRRARECLHQAQLKLGENGPVELLASDVRGVLNAYGEISGKVDNERMLDALFASFCIGK